MFASRIALTFGLLLATLPVQRAQADALLPDFQGRCTSGWVLKELKVRFHDYLNRYNGGGLELVEIINPRLNYERRRDEEHNVGRQFCHATVRLNDGYKRDMWYLLETPWNFAGIPGIAGLEFCVSGLDPWYVYGKDCSTIRNSIGW